MRQSNAISGAIAAAGRAGHGRRRGPSVDGSGTLVLPGRAGIAVARAALISGRAARRADDSAVTVGRVVADRAGSKYPDSGDGWEQVIRAP